MPRIRTIKPEFWADEKLAPLDPPVRLVFLGLICLADDAGRLLDNLKVIDAFIFPSTDHSAREALSTLSRIGRIARGKTSSGQLVIQIANWDRHQKVDHPNLAAALPQISELTEVTDVVEPLANHSRTAREPLATLPTTNDLRSTTNDPLAADAAGAPSPGTKSPKSERKPREPKPRQRNLLFDALAAIDGSDPAEITRNAAGRIGTALADIREASPDVTADEIRRRAAIYPLHFDKAALTPTALSTHWSRCAHPPKGVRVPPTPEDEDARRRRTDRENAERAMKLEKARRGE